MDMNHRFWHKLWGTRYTVESITEHTSNYTEHCKRCGKLLYESLSTTFSLPTIYFKNSDIK